MIRLIKRGGRGGSMWVKINKGRGGGGARWVIRLIKRGGRGGPRWVKID